MSLYYVPAPLITLILFAILVSSYVTGHLLRRRRLLQEPEHMEKEFGAIGGTLLGLLALLLAFTFGMANNRFDATRNLVTDEANAIGTAIKRAQLYPDSAQLDLIPALKNYVETRIGYYEVGHTEEDIHSAYLASGDSLSKIWAMAGTLALQYNDLELKVRLLPAINAMMDITTQRIVARESTVPQALLYFLFILSISASFLLGYERVGKIDWIITLGFTLMLSLTVYAILDIDRPRRGFITLDKVHHRMYELRDAF